MIDSIISTLMWGSFAYFVIVRIEQNYKAYLASRKPLAQEQADQLAAKINDLEGKVNDLLLIKSMEDR